MAVPLLFSYSQTDRLRAEVLWLLVFVFWLLAFCFWLLAFHFWLLVQSSEPWAFLSSLCNFSAGLISSFGGGSGGGPDGGGGGYGGGIGGEWAKP